MANTFMGHGMGWARELPDLRDFTLEQPRVQKILQGSAVLGEPTAALETSIDLRKWCPPIEDQGQLGSCTAQAGVGLMEYYERRAFNTHLDASRLFLYKVTRNLLHWTGDPGAYLRTTLKAMVLFGVPPEEYWPYDVGRFEQEPPAFCYAFAQNYQPLSYLRLDPAGTLPEALLARIKQMLVGGFPSIFGFTVYSSLSQAASTGEIPFPQQGDRAVGGHAVMAVGYDDRKSIGGRTGALLIRNSWGRGWGREGYGWLPYAYVESGLAVDWWTITKLEWINTGNFG